MLRPQQSRLTAEWSGPTRSGAENSLAVLTAREDGKLGYSNRKPESSLRKSRDGGLAGDTDGQHSLTATQGQSTAREAAGRGQRSSRGTAALTSATRAKGLDTLGLGAATLATVKRTLKTN